MIEGSVVESGVERGEGTSGAQIGRLRAILEIMLVIVAFVAASMLLGPWLGVPLAALALYAGVGAGWGLLHLSGETWADVGLRTPRRGVVRAGFVVAFVGLAMFLGVMALQAAGLPPIDLSPLRDEIAGDPYMYVATLVLVVWGSAAFAEELIFRGFVLHRLEAAFHGVRRAAPFAVAGQALLFALAHSYQGVTGMLYSGSVGLLFGWVYVGRGRNLWIVILGHGLIDTVAVTLLYFALL